MTDHQTTHAPGCWSWGPKHYECAVSEVEALRMEVERLRKAIDRAWNEGFDFAVKACGWQEGEDPATEGLYVVRDSNGNVEVGMWCAKTVTRPAEWTREFRDVDRDDIVAWMAIPDWRTARDAYKLSDAMLRAREVERLREDAERYRWLRDREIPEWLDLWHQNPDRIDAAIDAMIRAQGGEQ